MNDAPQSWTPNGTAFCWQPKSALHRIREALDGDNSVSSGLLVYVALTEIASDKRQRRFQTTHGFIAMRCGLSQRTVQQRIKDLVAVGVIACEVPNLKAPATYTLLPIEQGPAPRVTQPLHSDAKQLRNDRQPLHSDTQRQKDSPLPSSQECIEEISEEKGKSHTPALQTAERISLEKELGRIATELKNLGTLSDYDKGSKKYNRILELTAKQSENRKVLGVIA